MAWTCKQHSVGAHDIFISYRVKSEKLLAKMLMLALENKGRADGSRLTVFLDQVCLNDGEDWESGFMAGLNSAKFFLPLISAASLQGIQERAASSGDNVLLEIEGALDRAEAGGLTILPVLVGDYVEAGGDRLFRAFKTPAMGSFPSEPHASPKSGRNIRETMQKLFKFQGIRMDPDAPDKEVPSIIKALEGALGRSGGRALGLATTMGSMRLGSGSGGGGTGVVNPGQDVQAAIDAAEEGATVFLAPGTHKAPRGIVIRKNVVLQGSDGVILTSSEACTVLSKAKTAAIRDVKIVQSANGGAALLIEGGGILVEGCDIIAPQSDHSTVIINAGNPILSRCSIHGGSCRIGVDFNRSTKARMENCVVSEFSGQFAVAVNDGSPMLIGNQIINNDGVGIYIWKDAKPTLENNDISGNGTDIQDARS